jgi:hypothetical protein
MLSCLDKANLEIDGAKARPLIKMKLRLAMVCGLDIERVAPLLLLLARKS